MIQLFLHTLTRSTLPAPSTSALMVDLFLRIADQGHALGPRRVVAIMLNRRNSSLASVGHGGRHAV